jgi:hypothetical protein
MVQNVNHGTRNPSIGIRMDWVPVKEDVVIITDLETVLRFLMLFAKYAKVGVLQTKRN